MPETTVTTPKKEPTASEAKFFFAIVKHMRNKADIDWEAVAAEQNFKILLTVRYFYQVRFGQVKRKLGITTTDSPGSSVRAPGKNRDGSMSTPTKVTKNTGRTGAKGRSRPKVKKEEKVEEDVDDEDVGSDKSDAIGNNLKAEAFEEPSHFDDAMAAADLEASMS
ncbi:hypothetical protein CDD83_7951 [Cordyceps sp. RAO-2017]|nr:hypothetical protein CDD83_7951 [Cordyceps sp. RAO-2017]